MRTGHHSPSADPGNSKGVVTTTLTPGGRTQRDLSPQEDARLVSLRTGGALDALNPSGAGIFPGER